MITSNDMSELISEMAIRYATVEELNIAIKYSADIIDAEKQKIELIRSELDRRMSELMAKYKLS